MFLRILDFRSVLLVRWFLEQHPALVSASVWVNNLAPVVLVAIILWWAYTHARAARAQRVASRVYTVVVKIFVSGAAAYIVSRVIGFIHFRPRPFVAMHFAPYISESPFSKSFPSSHAIVAFALAAALYHFNKKFGAWALVVAAIIACARVAVGVHYPSDILAGAVLGVLVSWGTLKLWRNK